MRYLLILLISHAAFAKTEAAVKPKEKLNCTDQELVRQDCHLVAGLYDIRLLPKTVAWSDGTWHTVDPMPLAGEAVEWERAGFRMLAGRPILQVWLWEKGFSETQVQSLHWFVADAEKRRLTILQAGIVRKRRPEEMPVAPASDKKASVAKDVKKKYLYDGWEPHYVKGLPNGSLEWQLAGQKKIIPKVDADQGHKQR
jgi:hypothetical protein